MRLQCVINHRKIICSSEPPRSLISFVPIDLTAISETGGGAGSGGSIQAIDQKLNDLVYTVTAGKKTTKICSRSYISQEVLAGLPWRRWAAASYTRSKGLQFVHTDGPIRVQATTHTHTHTHTHTRVTRHIYTCASIRSLLLSVINLSVHIHAPHSSTPQEHSHDDRFQAGELFSMLPLLLGAGSQLWTPCDLWPTRTWTTIPRYAATSQLTRA